MTKKNYSSDKIYCSLHSKMYLVVSPTECSDGRSLSYNLFLHGSSLPFDGNDLNTSLSVALTSSAAKAFLDYTMSPDSLINVFAYLCVLCGKDLVS